MARGQFPFQLRDASGDVISSATVTITVRAGGGAATHWSAETGGTSSTGTTSPDANGIVDRWLDEGSYNAAITGVSNNFTRSFEIVRGDGVTTLADNSVNTNALANNAVGTTDIADLAVGTTALASGGVAGVDLATDAASARTIITDAVTEPKIANNAVSSAHIQADAVTAAKLGNGSVGTTQLGTDAITLAKVASNTVQGNALALGSITDTKIAADTFASTNFADNAIQRSHLVDALFPIGTILPFSGTVVPTGWLLLNGQTVSSSTYATLYGRFVKTKTGTYSNGSAVVTALGTTSDLAANMWVLVNGVTRQIQTVNSGTQVTLTTTVSFSGAHSSRFYWVNEDFQSDSSVFRLPDMRGRVPVHPNPTATSVGSTLRLGINDGSVLASRGAKHNHDVGTLTVASSGAHAHFYAAPTSNGMTEHNPLASTYREYGHFNAQTSGVSTAHTHGITGTVGDSSLTDSEGFLTVNYIIRAL